MKYRHLLAGLLLLINASEISSQFYQSGQPPSSVKWRQINTGNFRLIFPETFGSQAGRIAGLLEESRDLTGHTLNHYPGSIPVIIHNHTVRSNGLVVWAPKRMELYTTPPQSARGGEWLSQLVIHEQRHVVQLEKLNQGLTSAFSYLLGEQAVGIAAGRLPLWFLEGDAVTTETVLTLSGRGRTPSFDMPLRTHILSSDKAWSYDKFLHGSFKDYVPDHYQYGLSMVSSLREKYGPGIWENTLDYVGRRPLHPAPFAWSLRKITGRNLRELHSDIVSGIREEYGDADDIGARPGSFVLNRRNDRHYHSYRYPVWSGDSATIALKTGIGINDQFVNLDIDGTETILHYPGVLSSPSFTLSENRIAWSEFQPDPRWGLRWYSVLKILDVNNGRVREISSQSRYFSPAFAPDGLFLGVVETDLENSDHIVIINSVTGEPAGRYPAPDGKNLQRPVFATNERIIYMTSVSAEGTSILSLDIETGLWEELLEPAFLNISGVFPCNEMLCFHSDMAGTDQLFAMEVSDGTLYRLPSGSGYGAFDGALSPSGHRLVWSDYTINGYDLVLSGFEKSKLELFDTENKFVHEKIAGLASQEKGILKEENYDSAEPESKPYRKGLNLFRLHSWSPFYYDYNEFNIEEMPIYPGVTLLSQDLLGTANTFLGYSYRQGRHIAHGSFIYSGWYPVVEVGFDYGGEPLLFAGRDTIGPRDLSPYNRLNLNGTVHIPFNFSGGRNIAGMEPRFRLNYNNNLYHYDSENNYKKGMTTTEFRFFGYRYRRLRPLDLAPAWGQVFRWRILSSPFETENLGSINAAELTLYMPGLFPFHSIRLDAGVQRQDPVKYYYSSLLNFPRGYRQRTTERLQVLRSNYLLPLIYPDLSAWGLIYLKRVHANLFADFGMNSLRVLNNQTNSREWQHESLFSWGGGLTANFHLLRIIFPFNMTAGFAHAPPTGETTFLFSFGVNLDIF